MSDDDMPDLTSAGDSDDSESESDELPPLDDHEDSDEEQSHQEVEKKPAASTSGAADAGQRCVRSSGIKAGFLVNRGQSKQDRSPAPAPTSAPAPAAAAANGHTSAKEHIGDDDNLPSLVALSESDVDEETSNSVWEEEVGASGDDNEMPELGEDDGSDGSEDIEDEDESQSQTSEATTEDLASDDGIPALESQDESDNNEDDEEEDESEEDYQVTGQPSAHSWGGPLHNSNLHGMRHCHQAL
jgi:hypothetical protein